MPHSRFSLNAIHAFCAFAAAFLMLPAASAIAAPKRLDCNLTNVETRVGQKSDSAIESRPIIIAFDKEAKTLSVYQDGSARALNNVTISEISMNGSVDEISLGIDPSSLNIVFQTYGINSVRAEFGACSQSLEPLP